MTTRLPIYERMADAPRSGDGPTTDRPRKNGATGSHQELEAHIRALLENGELD